MLCFSQAGGLRGGLGHGHGGGARHPAEAETAALPHHLHRLPAGRAGEGLRANPVPRHLHQGGAQPEDQAQ